MVIREVVFNIPIFSLSIVPFMISDLSCKFIKIRQHVIRNVANRQTTT